MMDTEAWEIAPTEDLIDSRSIIDRIAVLEADENRDDDETAELAALVELAAEAEGYAPDWHYGETLIRDSYFETYARDLAEDCGMVDADAKWPACHIDWQAAAEALEADYTEVTFAGVDYWVR